tara:strand:+ start:2918 stop:5317 length:2400 start_codon:yes stop_codon:yes gene_type:complete
MLGNQPAAGEYEQNAVEDVNVSVDDQAAYERIEQALKAYNDEQTLAMHEQAHHPAAAPQLADEATQAALAVNQTQGQFIEHAAHDPEVKAVSQQHLERDAARNTAHHNAPQLAEPFDAEGPTGTSETLRGNPYMLAASTGTVKQESEEERHDLMDDTSPVAEVMQQTSVLRARDDAAQDADVDRNGGSLQYSGHVDQEVDVSDQASASDSVISDDEEMDEEEEEEQQVADLRSRVQQNAARAQSTWAQRQQLFPDDFQLEGQAAKGPFQRSRANATIEKESGFEESIDQHFPNSPAANYYNSPHQNMPFDPMFSGAMNAPRHQNQSMPPHQTLAGLPIDFGHGGSSMPPFPYRDMFGPGYQHTAYGAPHMNVSYGQYPQGNYGMPPPSSRHPQPSLGLGMHDQYFGSSHPRDMAPSSRVASSQQQKQRRRPPKVVDEHDCGEEQESDDDEPLLTRVKRHPSATSDSVMGDLSPPVQDAKHSNAPNDADDSDVEFVSSKSTKKIATAPAQEAAPLPRPLPQPAPPTNADRRDSSSSSNAPIDWALPKFDAQFEPGKTKHDPTVAKISIPNLVREELLLSPDHAEQETHLLLQLFLPAQQAREWPDPEPAAAVLNFHTIAVMVIEAFVQFEIGDEFGTGRGHWHNDHDQSDGEYERLRDAKDADPDEIFFAVIDRWRAGLESNKQPSKLIRGSQEFCDIALDVIYYIKEHGLLKEKQRVARSDKVVKRGAKKVGEGKVKTEDQDGEKVAKGVKRGAQTVNTVEARKKVKTEKGKGTAKEKSKRKKKDDGPAITVFTSSRKK